MSAHIYHALVWKHGRAKAAEEYRKIVKEAI